MPEKTAVKSQTLNFVEGESTVIAVTCEFHPNGYTDGRHEDIYEEWKTCVKLWLERNKKFKDQYEGSLYLLDKMPPHGQFFLMHVFNKDDAAKAYSTSDSFERMVGTFAGEFKVVSNAVSVYQSGQTPSGG